MFLASDFFRYIAPTPEADNWGVIVTGAGRFAAKPGQPYPPRGHPRDHHFTWERGRVLGALQIVYVREGRGEFSSRAELIQPVISGNALLLRPGIWHRYRPVPETGWVEQWVELEGPFIQKLLHGETFSKGDPVVKISRRLEFEERLNSVHRLVTTEPAGHAPELAACALGLLAIIDVARHERQRVHPINAAVAQAKRLMEESEAADIAMPELAKSLGVAYSHFRREFRRRTGISPRQYLLRIRMQRAQRLLGSTDETLKQIADRLGFSSPYHLSTAFKATFHIAPSQWRLTQTVT